MPYQNLDPEKVIRDNSMSNNSIGTGDISTAMDIYNSSQKGQRDKTQPQKAKSNQFVSNNFMANTFYGNNGGYGA